MPELTLGLDLGPNSIGWALIDEMGGKLVASGARVFPEGVDNFDTGKEKPKNEGRRIARGMRRQIARRARRKRKLRQVLIDVGLLPADQDEQAALDQLDPYELRCRALDEKLTLQQFGRLLVHLNQRRGFLSNRKSDRQRKKETQRMLAEISELANAIEQSDSRTLGEHLARLHEDNYRRVRNRHTRRDMYLAEFDAVWAAQRKHHSELLTDELKQRIHRLIFFQRKTYWPKSVVGLCELEPKQRRCPRADRIAQCFRLLQEVNNLRYIDPDTHEECLLSAEHRTLLLDKLSKTKEMKFDNIRKALGFLESVHFNLESGNRTKLQGMVTDAILANRNIFGTAWHGRPEKEKDEIIRALIHQDEEDVRRLALTEWGLDEQAADKLLDADLPARYLHLSRLALEKLVPHMERGLLYMTNDDTPSALSEAGYLRPDQIQRRIHDCLPHPPDLPNPVVRQALFEVRKVINAIIREYGKPARIRIELARDVKATSEQRKAISRQMRDREAMRDEAAERLREHGVKVTRDAIDRYLLWEEQGCICVYSGESISLTQLLAGEVDVDHILPYSRCLDGSIPNKVVCFRSANAEKGNRTPHEWLAESDPKRFEQIRQRAAKLPYNKRRRFTQKTLELDQFINRQLSDTRYISRAVLEYVRCLFANPHDVLCIKGQQTATLRRHWGLNTVLRQDDLDLKNREDHRHHAVDAIVLALTNRSRLQQLADIHRRGGTEATGEILLDPWDGFREDVEEAVNQINVSHRVRRKVSGALHEDTLYGPTHEDNVFVVRKPLEGLTLSMIDEIRDPQVREIVVQRLYQHGIEHGRGKNAKIPPEVWKEPLLMTRKSSRHSAQPAIIRKVRLLKRDQTIQPIRAGAAHVKPGSTHHLCIFEWEENGRTQRDAVFVTMLEATHRLREQYRRIQEVKKELEKQSLDEAEYNRQLDLARRRIVNHELPLIQRTHPTRPDAKFVMSLSRGEMVQGTFNGQERLVVVRTSVSTENRIVFVIHTDARRDKTIKKFSPTVNTLNARKVTVDPLGRIRPAND